MRFAVLYSKKDLAGINIAEQLKSFYLPQIPVIELKKDTIFAEDISEKKYPALQSIDFLVFATKHQSKSGKPSLSLHAPGNFRDAKFGGKSGKVCNTSAFVLKYLFQNLKQNNYTEHETTLEVTHHGPYLEKPCCFIEIGSQEEHWKNPELGKIIAKTIATLQHYKPENWTPAIGIGGPHYCPNFNKIQLQSKYAISHIIAGYNKPITKNLLQEAEKKTKEQIKTIIIDWKSFKSEERQEAINIIKELGLDYKRTNKIKK